MNHQDRMSRDLARLEAAQRRTQARLQAEQERINQRFEHMRARLAQRYGEPNDHQQRIIAAALDLLDHVGLNELSLRKLAGDLNMQAPAIYWHFKSKDELIDYMAEAILQSEFHDLQPRPAGLPWQDWLVDICQRLRQAMRSRRDGARIVAGAHLFPAVTLLRIFETTQESLISDGVDLRQADLIATTAIHLTFGRVIEEQSSPGPEDLEKIDHGELLRDFPHVAASTKQTIKDMKNGYDEFEASLRLIVGEANTEK